MSQQSRLATSTMQSVKYYLGKTHEVLSEYCEVLFVCALGSITIVGAVQFIVEGQSHMMEQLNRIEAKVDAVTRTYERGNKHEKL